MVELCSLRDGTDFYLNGVRFTKVCKSSQIEFKCYNHDRTMYQYFGKYVKVKPVG